MGELDVLRQRIEQADLQLRTAHSTREREGAALREMWEQISGRLAEQNTELARLRARVAELEDAKEELLGMVHTLLGAVENGVDTMRDETVPRIAAVAGEMLGTMPEAHASKTDSFQPDLPKPSRRAATEDRTPAAIHEEAAAEEDKDKDVEIAIPEQADESLSPGIRDLIGRIEGSFADGTAPTEEDGEEESELARDLREIEALRNELSGLRARMSAEGG